MIEIEALPSPLPLACSTCCEPLTWIYVHHLARNIAVVPLRGVDRFSFRIHTCDLKPSRDWRYVQKVAPETTRRGMRRARMVAAAAEAKAKNSIEKEKPSG